MKTRYTLPVVAATAVVVNPIVAHATTIVDFSFSGQAGGAVAGVLTFSSAAGSSQQPASVTITGLPNKFKLSSRLPLDLKNGFSPYGNGFTFSSGHVKAASFRYFFGSATLEIGYRGNNLFLSHTTYNTNITTVSTTSNGGTRPVYTNTSIIVTRSTLNKLGFSAVKFSPASVPEPASITLLGAGIVGITSFRRRRRRRA